MDGMEMGWRTQEILEPMWSVMNDQTRNTKDSVQKCSILHVVLVFVRRVTLVIVHIGLDEVVVVMHFCVAICSWIAVSEGILFTPLSVTVDCCQLLPIYSR